MEAEQATSALARLLAARSELGYTHVPALALRDEPEAVDEATQRELTRAARLRATREVQRSWAACREAILGHIAGFQVGGRVDPRLAEKLVNDLRQIERALGRIDRLLADAARVRR